MDNFIYTRNPENSYFRNLIISLKNFFDSKLFFINYIDNKPIKINVPFYYNLGGDERFLQDLFESQSYDDFIDFKKVEGNIDSIPRGIFTFTDGSVNAAELTSRFIYGKRAKLENGELKTEYAQLNLIPLIINMECEILVSTKIEVFKILENIIKTFFKMHIFDFIHDSQYIRTFIGFPESNAVENLYTFSFGEQNTNKINFTLELKTYLPTFDEQYYNKDINNRINSFDLNVTDKNIIKNANDRYSELYGDAENKYSGNLNSSNSDNINLINDIDHNLILDNQRKVYDDSEKYNFEQEFNFEANAKYNSGQKLDFKNLIYKYIKYLPSGENINNNFHIINQFGLFTDTLLEGKSIKKFNNQ